MCCLFVSSGNSAFTHSFLQSLVQLSHLVVLDITKNKVEQFPPGLSRLAALSDLHASENCIEELPEDFGEMYIDSIWETDLTCVIVTLEHACAQQS